MSRSVPRQVQSPHFCLWRTLEQSRWEKIVVLRQLWLCYRKSQGWYNQGKFTQFKTSHHFPKNYSSLIHTFKIMYLNKRRKMMRKTKWLKPVSGWHHFYTHTKRQRIAYKYTSSSPFYTLLFQICLSQYFFFPSRVLGMSSWPTNPGPCNKCSCTWSRVWH